MPPKAKKESGRAKKAENEAKKKSAADAEKERKEADAWTDKDVKGAREEKEAKRQADLARRAENARLLAEEEAVAPPKVKVAPKAAKKSQKPAGPGALAAGGGLGVGAAASADAEPTPTPAPKDKEKEVPDEEPQSFAATGIDNMLDLLDVVTAKADKASVGQQAAGIERHPEAAFEAYQERELPVLRKEHPGLRLQQYKDMMFKAFQKAPENPFNQTVVDYDATKEEKLEALKLKKAQVEERLREKRSS
ncbi:DUF1014-domain-containing protein [Mycena pura]|uniref:DUF1014-domain-containing protein n=1 Tax=Mycena pura TaxID=153505 RepID=A0AAD6YI60_9AGAR|nr:DUF1014-domain-containing protein [Mycena pura]